MLKEFDKWIGKSNWIDNCLKSIDSYQRMIDHSLHSYKHLAGSLVSVRDTFNQQSLSTISNITYDIHLPGIYEDILKTTQSMNDKYLTSCLNEASLLHESILKNQSMISQLLPDYKDLVLPGNIIGESYALIKALSERYEAPSLINRYALENTLSYQEFVSVQLNKIADDSDIIARRRALIIDHVGRLFNLTEGSVAAGYILDDEVEENEDDEVEDNEYDEDEGEFVQNIPNLYPKINQHIAFLYREDVEIEDDGIEKTFYSSIPAKINMWGNKLITLVIQITENSERKGDPHFFRPTPRSMEACQKIPTLIAENEFIFTKIINLLYFTVYEGFGGQENRLTNVLNKSQLNPLWDLKHIRNDINHDLGHGEKKKVVEKFKKIGNIYNAIIGKHKPCSGKDYRTVQLHFYVTLNAMLKEVIKVIE